MASWLEASEAIEDWRRDDGLRVPELLVAVDAPEELALHHVGEERDAAVVDEQDLMEVVAALDAKRSAAVLDPGARALLAFDG